MLEDILLYLDHRLSDDVARPYVKGFNVLYTVGVNSAIDEANLLLQEKINYPVSDVLVDLQNIIESGMDNMFLELGVQIEAPMFKRASILEGILMLAEYEDLEIIKTILSTEDSAIEKLCDLLPHTTPYTSIELADYVLMCRNSLLDKLYQAAANQTVEEAVQHDMSKMAAVKQMIKDPKFTVNEMCDTIFLMEGLSVNHAVESYIEKPSIKDSLASHYPTDPKRAAHDLLLITLVSDTAPAAINKTACDIADQLYPDLKFSLNVIDVIKTTDLQPLFKVSA